LALKLPRRAAGLARAGRRCLAAILAVALKGIAAVVQAADAVAGTGAAEPTRALAATALEVAAGLAAGGACGELAVVDAKARGAVAASFLARPRSRSRTMSSGSVSEPTSPTNVPSGSTK
jgi:hypothetical protein